MSKFVGFSKEGIEFLNKVKLNNNKPWFDAHYDFYQKELLEVSRDLVEDLGEQLQQIAPNVNVVPKVNGSIYRFARDARFSKDKTPYKTHLSYLFWQGTLKRTRCPGFYMGIRPGYIQLGVGINHFTPEYLQAWREQCAHPKKGQEIREIFDALKKSGVMVYGEQLKRIPRGFSTGKVTECKNLKDNGISELLNEDLIRYKGLKCWYQLPLPEQVYSADFIKFCFFYYQNLLPLFEWMVEVLNHFSIETDFSDF
ncbi:MAG: TIGR02453 family protein [Gammaproteobacteria bacterium]|nr:TIGR02453 family protein [Gammaproteobacteria bacterium]